MPIDYSKLSDDTLNRISKGEPIDYSKLSDDELNIIAGSPQLPEEPGMGESALRGAAQGATFGFADEITGALEAAGKGISGEVDNLDDLKNVYQKSRDESREAYETAEDINPWTYNISNILGGFAVPAGAIGTVGKGAGFAEKALAGLKAGAAAGTAAGIGMSKGDLTEGDFGTVAKEAALGGAIGGGLGAAAGGVIPAATNKLDDVMSQFKAYQLTKRAHGAALEGTELFGEQAKNKLLNESREQASLLMQGLDEQQGKIGKQMGSLIDEQTGDVIVEPTIRGIIEDAPLGMVNRPEDVKKIGDIEKTLNNIIQKVERKEAVITPVGATAKASQMDKVLNKINQVVASGNKTAYDNLARYIAAKEQGLVPQLKSITRTLNSLGVDLNLLRTSEGKLTPEMLSIAKGMTNPDDIAGLSAKLQQADILPAPRIVTEFDPQTGLDVVRSVRGDSTISMAVPKELEKMVTNLKIKWEPKSVINRPKLNGRELEAAIRDLKTYANDPTLAKEIRDWAKNSANKLNEQREGLIDSDALSALKKQYATVGQAKAEIGAVDQYGADWASRADKVQMEKSLAKTIEDAFDADNQATLGLNKSLDELAKVNPDLSSQLGLGIKETSRDLSVARALTAEAGLGGSTDPFSKLTQIAGRSIPTAGAYVLGKAQKAVTGDASKKLTTLSKGLYEMMPEQLQGIVAKLKQKGSPFADKLERALEQPHRKRNALLFTLMQQPGFREEIEDKDAGN